MPGASFLAGLRNVRVAVYMGCVGWGWTVCSWHRANTADTQSSGAVLEGSAGDPGAIWGWSWVQVLPLSLPVAGTQRKRALLRREVLARGSP